MIKFILRIPVLKQVQRIDELFIRKPDCINSLNTTETEIILWGDSIIPKDLGKNEITNLTADYIINNIKGHYYFLILDIKKGNFIIGSSLFNILPVYYSILDGSVMFSENALDLKNYVLKKNLSKRFILESVLFNYPLFNQSIIEGIKLLPSNSYMVLSEGEVKIIKHTRIEDFFSTSPQPWKESIYEIQELFFETVKKYLPEGNYLSSLTGGFDGRALVSAGIYFKKGFSCFSFGSSTSKDITIASQLSQLAGIPFMRIDLDDIYAWTNSLDCGREFILNSSGTGTFSRAHYLYAAKELSKKAEYIVTGNFGSEIFRAVHNPGVVFSPNLYHLFKESSTDKAFILIEKSTEYSLINSISFKNEWEELKEDIINLPSFSKEKRYLTQNQRFYLFIFEEVFRKYFGSELINQFLYLKNRTPFLDIIFLKAILQTGLSGIHSAFFENNPFKRYKGQVLYAHIINEAYPPFGKMSTDKGYCPDDLLRYEGILKVIYRYFSKVSGMLKNSKDPYGVSNAWLRNRDFYYGLKINSDFFNINRISILKERETNAELFRILSLAFVMNSVKTAI